MFVILGNKFRDTEAYLFSHLLTVCVIMYGCLDIGNETVELL